MVAMGVVGDKSEFGVEGIVGLGLGFEWRRSLQRGDMVKTSAYKRLAY